MKHWMTQAKEREKKEKKIGPMKTNKLKARVSHTPTPWKCVDVDIETEDGNFIADCASNRQEAKANAEFIVTAVNAHEDLIMQLKEASQSLKDLAKDWVSCEETKKAVLIQAKYVDEALTKASVKI